MAFVAFPEPPELKVSYENSITDSKPKSFGYSVENPHPGYGTDPNILNELGHTKYPMWVGNQIANNEEEEKALRNPTASVPEAPAPAASNPWPTAT